MNLTRFADLSRTTFHAAGGEGDGGGGAVGTGGGAPTSSSGSDGGRGTSGGLKGNPAADSGGSAAATPIRLTDDALIALEGTDKPVKFGEHIKGLKGNLTKATQEKARLEKAFKALQAEKDALQQRIQAAAGGNGGGQTKTILDALQELPYLTGKDAAQVIGQITGALEQRDKALVLLYQQLQALKTEVGHGTKRNQEAEFGNKIGGYLKQLNLGEGYRDLLTEIYLAYEGDNLDEEFPEIAKKRLDQLRAAIRDEEKQRVAQAKKLPFIPGRGGQGTPSRPLQDKMRKASASDIADIVWDSLEGGAS